MSSATGRGLHFPGGVQVVRNGDRSSVGSANYRAGEGIRTVPAQADIVNYLAILQ
jgi:hypothetical protein